MNRITNNDEELVLKSLSHLNVIYKMSKEINSYDEFMDDKIKLDATIFHLTQIGELCTKFTDEFRKRHPNIEFRGIIGLRNVMVHGYGTLNFDDIFIVIKEDVPDLIDKYKNILEVEFNYKYTDKYIENYYNTRRFNMEDDA